jgi:hypothetical protein
MSEKEIVIEGSIPRKIAQRIKQLPPSTSLMEVMSMANHLAMEEGDCKVSVQHLLTVLRRASSIRGFIRRTD